MDEIINLGLTSDDQVLPCPFCGCHDDLHLENTWTPSYWMKCDRCSAEVHGQHFWNTKKITRKQHEKAKASAIKAWNRRAQ